jgi:hypothetical protein
MYARSNGLWNVKMEQRVSDNDDFSPDLILCLLSLSLRIFY